MIVGKSRSLQIVEDDCNKDGKKDLTIVGPVGPIATIYSWRQIIGFFCGLTLSIALAGLGVGSVLL